MSTHQKTISASIVVTTIHEGGFLQEYYDNFKKFDRLSQAHFYIIADKKTPASLYDRANALRQQGLAITMLNLEEQETYLTKVGLDPQLILWNSDYRRNIGYLQAYASESDIIISIDDDNYPLADEDFLDGHASAFVSSIKEPEVNSPTHFFNVCSRRTIFKFKQHYMAQGFTGMSLCGNCNCHGYQKRKKGKQFFHTIILG